MNNFIWISLYVLFGHFGASSTYESNSLNMVYKTLKNQKYKVLSTNGMYVRSFIMCAEKCLTSDCCGISYHDSSRQCFLLDRKNCLEGRESINGWRSLEYKLRT